jgi:hypothetical protein
MGEGEKGKVMIRIHVLKTWPEYWDAVADEVKRFEIRKDDRGYRVGDYLVLRKFDPKTETYLQPWLVEKVTYRTDANCPFLPPGIVAMGIREARYEESCAVLRQLRADNPQWPKEKS